MFNNFINLPCCNGTETIPAGPIKPALITAIKSFSIILKISPFTKGCSAFSLPIRNSGAPNVILLGLSKIIESVLARKIILFASPTNCEPLNLETFSVALSTSNTNNIPLYKFLIIPQAWTVGVELLFYLVAPFIVS